MEFVNVDEVRRPIPAARYVEQPLLEHRQEHRADEVGGLLAHAGRRQPADQDLPLGDCTADVERRVLAPEERPQYGVLRELVELSDNPVEQLGTVLVALLSL